MATEAETKNRENEEVEKNFISLSFRSKRNGGPDNDFIALGNRFAELKENDGVLPTTACRNLFRRALRIATGTADETDVEIFRRYIENIRNNGEQPANQS